MRRNKSAAASVSLVATILRHLADWTTIFQMFKIIHGETPNIDRHERDARAIYNHIPSLNSSQRNDLLSSSEIIFSIFALHSIMSW